MKITCLFLLIFYFSREIKTAIFDVDNSYSFLVLQNIKISTYNYFERVRKEQTLLSEVVSSIDPSYFIINEEITSHEVLHIKCVYKITKEFDKSELFIFLIKTLWEGQSKLSNTKDIHTGSRVIKELKKSETFLFENKIIRDEVISELQILVLNLEAFNEYYSFDTYITDGIESFKIPLFRIFIFFYNPLQLVSYPMKIENKIIQSVLNRCMNSKLKRTYNSKRNCYNDILKNISYRSKQYFVTDVYKDYYPSTLITKENADTREIYSIAFIILSISFITFLFLLYLYIIFIVFKFNIRKISRRYYNYTFVFLFLILCFLFLLYDLFFNGVQMFLPFFVTFFLFLLNFHKVLLTLRQERKKT